eukprot:6053945-Lingulodinium_polyedra.AAC.1
MRFLALHGLLHVAERKHGSHLKRLWDFCSVLEVLCDGPLLEVVAAYDPRFAFQPPLSSWR